MTSAGDEGREGPRGARPEPEIGATASAELVVSEEDLASSLRFGPGDAFPPVLATARMVALMEVAAARVLAPFLGPGELSVGVRVDVTHSAATPSGTPVTATARYLGPEDGLPRVRGDRARPRRRDRACRAPAGDRFESAPRRRRRSAQRVPELIRSRPWSRGVT